MVGQRDEHPVVVVDLVPHRLVREPLGQASHLAVERGGEQHGLAIGAEHLEDALHVREEPHVEHAVGLVQHADPHTVEAEQSTRHQIEQAPGRGDHDVRSARALRLRADRDAAVDGRDVQMTDVGDRTEVLGHLARELSGRREDQGRRAPAARRQPFDDGDGERERLARPRPRACEHVATGDRVTKDQLLDRERSGDAAHLEGVDDRRGDAELGESGERGGGGEWRELRELRRGGRTPWVHGSLRHGSIPFERCGDERPRSSGTEGSETAFTTRCRRMNALDLPGQRTRNRRKRDGGDEMRSYERASGCLYLESVCSQQVVPAL